MDREQEQEQEQEREQEQEQEEEEQQEEEELWRIGSTGSGSMTYDEAAHTTMPSPGPCKNDHY